MKLAQRSYCDFVTWNKQDLIVIRTSLDELFMEETIAKAKIFFKHGILPELLGKWYSRPAMHLSTNTSPNYNASSVGLAGEQSWCFCRKEEEGEMILCDNSNCPIQWFHLDCPKIPVEQVPQGKMVLSRMHKKLRGKDSMTL